MRLLPFFACVSAAAVAHAGQVQSRTVVYAPAPRDADAESLDLYVPDGAHGVPVLLFFHGGVWRVGDKAQYADVGRAFAARGLATAIANYPLVPEVTHAEQLRATARAIAWVSGHAREFGGNPKRVFLSGHSAGAELVATLMFRPELLEREGANASDVAGIVALAGIFDLGAPIDDSPTGGADEYIAPVFGTDRAALEAASPLHRLARTRAPWLVLAAEQDSKAMRTQSQRFARALEGTGTSVRLQTIPDRGHFELVSEMGQPEDPTADRIAAFVRGR